jgi:uncharacterized membrane protein YkvA (DUF1232 family)
MAAEPLVETTAMDNRQFQRAKLFATTYLASLEDSNEDSASILAEEQVLTHSRSHLKPITKQARAKAKQVGNEIYALIEMAEMHYKNRWTMDFFDLVLVTVCLAYVAAPIDAIPDLIPTIGYIDDAALVAFTVETLRDNIVRFQAWKDANVVDYQQGKEEICCDNPIGCTIL